MSTEDRLARLGLLHLQGQPEKLLAELERRSAEYDESVKAWNKTRERMPTGLAPGLNVTPRFDTEGGPTWYAALELVVARLRQHGFEADIANHFVALGETVDRREARRIATEEPYLIGGQLYFLPLGVGGLLDGMVAVSWKGSLAASKLIVLDDEGPECVLPGIARFLRVADNRVRVTTLAKCRLRGAELVSGREVGGPIGLVVDGELLLVFPQADRVIEFALAPEGLLEGDVFLGSLAVAAMDQAFLRKKRFSLMVIRPEEVPLDERSRAAVAALPTTVERFFGHHFGTLHIVAVGELDALLAYSDQLKEHFSQYDARVTEVISEAGESPESALEHLKPVSTTPRFGGL